MTLSCRTSRKSSLILVYVLISLMLYLSNESVRPIIPDALSNAHFFNQRFVILSTYVAPDFFSTVSHFESDVSSAMSKPASMLL